MALPAIFRPLYFLEGRRKKQEGRSKKEEARKKKQERRSKKEEGG
ncbi:MAG: hypothetical protein WCD53_02400 [Microcoleus sp.]